MRCSAADTHPKLLDSVISGASFIMGVFECDLAHRRSVAVLSMLYKINCNQMHPLYDALHVTYVPVRVTHGAVIAHRSIMRLLAAEPCMSRSFIPLSVFLWNDLGDPVLDGVGQASFKSRANVLLLANLLAPFV